MNWRELINRSPRVWLASLSIQSVGSWPMWAQVGATVAVLVFVLGCGYLGLLSGLERRLELTIVQGEKLRRDYERAAARAADLPTLAPESRPAEGAPSLLESMPGEADIPALLEAITRAAASNGLFVRSIDLLPERVLEGYGELPLRISVRGGYHEIGTFVSLVAGMVRLVTLHDFDLALDETNGAAGAVHMNLLAKAYRHLGPALHLESPSLPATGQFAYRAGERRSPFDPSVLVDMATGGTDGATVAPDFARPRQYLEHHPIDALAMVGTLSEGAVRYALVRDGAGRVHRLGVGQYLGENNGRIREINRLGVDFVEIVPNGEGGWVQRVRTLSLPSSTLEMKKDEQP